MKDGCKMKTIKISVIMSVYNEPIQWLKESIESILNQTFESFEFIIVLDNPDNYEIKKIIKYYKNKDDRIIFIENKKNIGLAKSLNKALKIASGKYIARMDGDDISLPDRLEKQYNYLEAHQKIDLIGCWVYKMDENGNVFGIMATPDDMSTIKKDILVRSVAFHPTWMVRKQLYKNLQGYRSFIVAQDYDFLLRVLDSGFIISSIKEPLLKYRISLQNVSSKKAIYQYKSALFALKLHRKRQNNNNDFNEEEYLSYIRTSKLMESIHAFANKMFVKSMGYKNNRQFFLFFLFFLFSLISPYQIHKILKLLKRRLFA